VKIIGMDPSLRGFGISDGTRHEVIRTKSGWDLDERIDLILERVDEFIDQREGDAIMIAIEAPLLNTRDLPGSHLYEIGALMRAIRAELVADMRYGATVIYLEVQVTTLRHHTVGVGNAAKENLPYMVEQIHGLTFEDDAGIDKLVAWSLWRYATAVRTGEIVHASAAARGQGVRARRSQRRVARERDRRLAS
jgi:Holliday junction resolvasome RuvABC endonuclease subunit